MKLTLNRKHLSIDELADVDLPDLTVLTGVNGSGKSHLLDAISLGHVLVDGVPNRTNVVKFNFETFKLENESAYTAQQLSAEQEAAWNLLQNQVGPTVLQLKQQLGANYSSFKRLSETSSRPLWKAAPDTPLITYVSNVRTFLSSPQIKGHAGAVGLYALAQKLPYSLDEITRQEFNALYQPYETKNDFLPQALGKIIWDYYVKYRSNQVNEYQNARHGKAYAFKTEEQFIAAYGEKPWDLINAILRQFDTLEYRLPSPEGMDVFSSFSLRLVHTKTPNLDIDFNGLSSGERVLMALVASIYKASADNFFPDVLLLDELDASLHPSMIKNMLAVIQEIFMSRQLKVILVTHSPSTVALAPEESLYLMNKRGPTRIAKTTKNHALSVLTEGFATLSEGMMIFDEVAQSPLSVITEGNNTRILERALQVHGVTGVRFIDGLEAITGKSQMKTLFDFLCKVPHKNKVVFVWDCDATYQLSEANRTHPFILPRNETNTLTRSGIENMFADHLFDGFKKTITLSKGSSKVEFDESRKRDFEEFILNRNNPADFDKFAAFIAEIRRIAANPTD